MRIAAIDIGTNTILMLIADLDERGEINVLADEQVIGRLGKGVDASGMILPETIERCRAFLASYREQAVSYGAEKIIVTGTSALRDARNGDEFIREMRRSPGLEVRVLTGEDEALHTYIGALSGLAVTTPLSAVLDIGGGSTELAIGDGRRILEQSSLDVGSVRVTERFLRHSPPTDEEIRRAMEFIGRTIDAFPRFDPARTACIGVAGTVTTLAALELGLETYDRTLVAGYRLKTEHVKRRFGMFRGLRLEELRSQVAIDAGRADIIFAGVMILMMFLETMGAKEIIVSERGLRYGIAMRNPEL